MKSINSRACRTLATLFTGMAVLVVVAPTAGGQSGAKGPRIALSEFWIGLDASTAQRGRTSALHPLVERKGFGAGFGFQASALDLMLDAIGIDMSTRRIRAGDYVMFAAGLGAMRTDQTLFDVKERNWFAMRGGYGGQASFLVTQSVEIGAAAGKMGVTDWARSGEGGNKAGDPAMGFGSGRVRVGRLGGEIVRATSPAQTFQSSSFEDEYLSASLRYRTTSAVMVRFDLDRHRRRWEDRNDSGTAARFLLGFGR